MKIKTKWGFIGNAVKLNADSNVVKAGRTFDADDEYAHTLIGKGLAVAVEDDAGAKGNKEAKPSAPQKANAEGDKQAKPKGNKEVKPAATTEPQDKASEAP
ncbi:hypothetical protein [Stenotrophomonas sp. SMYL8]|uniref:hypothetical protein n=1 Tax=Stenotrophomonas sp. SMYL8 TaxID=3076041 RepID=UPI002E799417|nr:hypothetical protein [Stenotrophomonas sp. SMYL8]